MELHCLDSEFHFEVDTPENAHLLADAFRHFGCEVLLSDHGTRMEITPRRSCVYREEAQLS